MSETPDEQTGKAEKPDPEQAQPGEQEQLPPDADLSDEAQKLAQQRVDDGQEGTIKADQEQQS